MSVPSAPVNVLVRFTRESVDLAGQLTDQAIIRAIDNTVARLNDLQSSGVSNVPIDTGRLRRSFAIAGSPRSIIMHWSATSPQGYDYALVQDIGRSNMVGKFYSDVMRDFAHRWLIEELGNELRAIQAVGG